MAVTNVGAVVSYTLTGATTASPGYTPLGSAGSRAVVLVIWGEGNVRPFSSVTLGGRTCTLAVTVGTSPTATIAYLLETDIALMSGTDIVVTWTGGTPSVGAEVHAYTFDGVDQTSPLGNTNSSNSASATSLSLSLTAATDSLVIAGAIDGTTGSGLTWTTATAQLQDGTGHVIESALYTPGSLSYSETITWGGSANTMAAVAATFLPSSGGSVAPIVAYYQSMQD